jgi:hypothetical protein
VVTDALGLAAVWNNASWCDAVARAHGCTTRTDDAAWTSATRTPPLYPDAVTRSTAARPADVLGRIDTSDGCGVKDSFAAIDLEPEGFEVLLEATWILRTAGRADRPDGWSTVRTAAALEAWEAAWAGADGPSGRTFPPSLASRPDCSFLARQVDGRVVAGAALHRSHGVVGVSNLFGPAQDLDRTWAEVVALASAGGEPLVGWEAGADLEAARRAGFDAAGPLQVWVR